MFQKLQNNLTSLKSLWSGDLGNTIMLDKPIKWSNTKKNKNMCTIHHGLFPLWQSKDPSQWEKMLHMWCLLILVETLLSHWLKTSPDIGSDLRCKDLLHLFTQKNFFFPNLVDEINMNNHLYTYAVMVSILTNFFPRLNLHPKNYTNG